jgi:hypothetical protein
MGPQDTRRPSFAFGTYEEARQWIGRRSEPRPAEVPVNDAMIRSYCALVEDGSPAYWEDGIAPPGLLMTWGFPIAWRPDGETPPSLFGFEVPLPGAHIINVSTDTEFFEHLRVGDHVTAVHEVLDISEEKRTRLGRGHFVTTLSTYSRQDGTVVARNTNVVYRYDAE